MRICTFPAQKTYAPHGSCIYCGSVEGSRTLEHIIPYALDGDLRLPDAVCNLCQQVTGWAERVCLKGWLGTARSKAGTRTRRPQQRSNTAQIGVIDKCHFDPPENLGDANFRWQDIPLGEHPSPIILPVLKRAGLLFGEAHPDGLVSIGTVAHMFQPKMPKLNAGEAVAAVPFRADAFSRMLAKIAHGLAVAELGTEAFEPLLPEYIFDKRSDYSRVIGSTRFGRIRRSSTVHASLHFEREFITVRLQLFGQYLKAPFEIVVGVIPGNSG